MNETLMRRAIARKRDGGSLEAPLWSQIVSGYLSGAIDDAQMSAFLMACVFGGTTLEETSALTQAFLESGETLPPQAEGSVDKHSSGGVADTASLIVVPLVAACGVPVAKLSGRALGHTGGTLDKLEAIPGVRTDLAPERMLAIVRDAGCAIGAQSERLVPADKRIYALRDRTATVPAPGLIAASIVSKKIASGARAIVYDVKVGRGAFVADEHAARDLAQTLVALTEAFGRRAVALVTDMNEPLGRAIGTGLEAIEARDFLCGTRRDPRLLELVLALAAAMLDVAGYAGDGRAALARALDDGSAGARFEAMLSAQGMHSGALQALRPHARATHVRAPRDGYVTDIDPIALGEAARDLVLQCGSLAGIVVGARIGERVRAGDVVATIHGDVAIPALESAFAFDAGAPAARNLVYFTIDSRAGAVEATGGAKGVTASRSTLETR